MKSKGFTLIELLAVIVILGIILVVAFPMVMNSKNDISNTLSEEQKKNLKHSGELVGLDLDDYLSDIYNCKSSSWIASKCEKNGDNWAKVTLTLTELKSHGYFEDAAGHCHGLNKNAYGNYEDGSIEIVKSGKTYEVDYNNVSCN